jgi:hypothetical protein
MGNLKNSNVYGEEFDSLTPLKGKNRNTVLGDTGGQNRATSGNCDPSVRSSSLEAAMLKASTLTSSGH